MDLFVQAAVGFGILAGAVFSGWQSWQARKRADHAASAATTAAKQTEGTGNGFAADVVSRLTRIESTGAATRALAETTHQLMVGHLEAHADSDLRKP